MQDILGYNREVRPNGAIISAEFATISLGSRMSLVQEVQGTYGQTVVPKFETGSPTLYFLTGQPMGSLNLSRLVGRGGFFRAFGSLRDSCARLIPINIGLDGTGGCTQVTDRGAGLQISGAVVQTMSFGFGAGALEVQEGATLQFANLR